MDSDEQMVTSSFAIDFFGDVTEPTVEQEEAMQAETPQVVNYSSESPTSQKIPPFKNEDANPNVSARMCEWMR